MNAGKLEMKILFDRRSHWDAELEYLSLIMSYLLLYLYQVLERGGSLPGMALIFFGLGVKTTTHGTSHMVTFIESRFYEVTG